MSFPRAVIFDMDGLMFDTERIYMQAWDYAGEKLGLGPCGYMVIKTLGMTSEKCYAAWREEFGDRYDREKVRYYSHEFQDRYFAEHTAPEKKGLRTLLDYLAERGVPMAVASSSHKHEVEQHLSGAGLLDRFCVIVHGDEVAHSKPDPEIYRTACERLDVPPQDCLAL